ncbi:D-alanyl-D-alanine carboxypeptidase/D-alanyl-D-alanine-endopeptidase [Marinactinospora rubrisoli]|uniref:D-alanyl-D-alanine carboxypeptidase/D-alanyl-D-alanine-endopeptidase n=1 Tax=Marinactinospora rubrisoli TaxID=2715399 RepID=A0ABW2KJC9_9ACTN
MTVPPVSSAHLRRPARSLLAAALGAVTGIALLVPGGPAAADTVPPAPTAAPGVTDLRADINALLRDPLLEGATSGLVVRSLTEGDVLYRREPGTPLIPASNAKLLASAAALDVLGAGHRFVTTVDGTAAPRDGVVHGDLYLVGTGDPTMTAERYDRLAADVAASGVTAVTGDLLADDTWFDDERLGAGWHPADEPYYYAAQISALTVAANDDYDTGVVEVTVTPGRRAGDRVRVGLTPATDYVTVVNRARTVRPADARGVSITRAPGGNTITVSGTLPAGGAAQSDLRTVHEPTDFAAHVFADALAEHGVSVGGRIGRGTRPAGAVRLARTESATLAEILVPAMKLSNNGHAEMLIKAIGQEVSGEGSWRTGLAEVEAALDRFGVGTRGLELRDGSGLDRANRIPARLVADLLEAAREQPWSAEWENALPVAGAADRMVGGTLTNRMRGTAAAGNVRAKTGSLTGVSSLSGYVTGADGERLVFAILNNGYSGSPPRPVQDAIAVRLAEFSRTTPTPGVPRVPAAGVVPLRAAETGRAGEAGELECTWARAC